MYSDPLTSVLVATTAKTHSRAQVFVNRTCLTAADQWEGNELEKSVEGL